MRLSDLLAPDRVLLGVRARDKAALLDELARQAGTRLGVEAPAILAALAARERLGSTGFGRGFALPHARVAGVARMFGLFARLARPIAFDAIDGAPVDLVFLLLIPPGSGNEHVAALAAVAREMRDETVVRQVRNAATAEALCEALS
jgi:PTS system nitrogen regulatory IIA component